MGNDREIRFAIVLSNYYAELAERLEAGARSAFEDGSSSKADLFTVPGAFEIPMASKIVADSSLYSGIACLGVVVRGETDHHRYINTEVARGIQEVQMSTGIPCGFGLVTCDSIEQAAARTGGAKRDVGRQAATAVIALHRMRAALGEPTRDRRG